ncbi:unnamed protein product [Leuciscus chuanchicus]
MGGEAGNSLNFREWGSCGGLTTSDPQILHDTQALLLPGVFELHIQDSSASVEKRREVVLRCLIEYMGKRQEDLISGTTQRELDEALINMVVKDLQPFTIVDDEGFREFVNKLDPSYVLPSRKVLKIMVSEKYNKAKEKTMEDLQKAEFVSLTADMY